jgi:hypothetical protein
MPNGSNGSRFQEILYSLESAPGDNAIFDGGVDGQEYSGQKKLRKDRQFNPDLLIGPRKTKIRIL